MNLPKELFDLCCRNFFSWDDAEKASPYPGDCRIQYAVITGVSPSTSPTGSFENRCIELTRLPNGLYVWLPNHPDDLAAVIKAREADKWTWRSTQSLSCEYRIPSHAVTEDHKSHARRRVKNQIISTFAEKYLDQGSVYRISFHLSKGASDRGKLSPSFEYIVSARLFFAETDSTPLTE